MFRNTFTDDVCLKIDQESERHIDRERLTQRTSTFNLALQGVSQMVWMCFWLLRGNFVAEVGHGHIDHVQVDMPTTLGGHGMTPAHTLF